MFLALGAACIFGSALDAQSIDFSAKVPFGFQVRGKDFAAGRYVVREHGYLGIPSVQNAENGETVFIAGSYRSVSQAGQPKLVFHCYSGHTCFLSEIRLSSGPGCSVAMSAAEKEIVNSPRPSEMATISVDLRHAD